MCREQGGKQVRQGSRVPMVRGRGWGWWWWSTGQFWIRSQLPRPNGVRVEELHLSAGNYCKGSDLLHRRQNTKKGRSIQAGQKDPVVLAPPSDQVDPWVQESQGAQGFLADSPLKVLLVPGDLLDLGILCLDFLFLP